MQLREATAGDADPVRSLAVTAARAGGRDHYGEERLSAWAGADAARCLSDPDRTVVVAESGGAVVGFAAVAPGAGEVTAVYVRPERAREGVGSALLSRLERAARAADAGAVRVLSSLNAVGFYRRAGYERVGRRTRVVDGVAVACVRLRKPLD